MKTNAYTM